MFGLSPVLVAFVVAVMAYWWIRPKKGKLPPGPWPLPVLGNALQIGTQPHKKFLEWAKFYGPIYRIKIGSMNAVILNDAAMIREIFNVPVATGRMSDNPVVQEIAKGPYGVFNTEGTIWEEQRKFAVKTLQSLGMGKSSMESLIMDEVNGLLFYFNQMAGTPISGCRLFTAPVVNSLWKIISGERCVWEKDTTIRPRVIQALDEFVTSLNIVSTNGILFAPFLRHLAPEYLQWNRYKRSLVEAEKVFSEKIEEHEKTLNPDDPRDFIDQFLVEMKNAEGKLQSSFHGKHGHRNLVVQLFDLFLGGSETTANVLSWSMLYLIHHLPVQTKIQEEVDLIIGSGTPSLTDRSKMPFTEACVQEFYRLGVIVPLGVPHVLRADKHFHGYDLPKGTAIFSNLYGVHNDPKFWEEPNVFRPERFLKPDGTMTSGRHPGLMPFSVGKRKCPGESLSRNTAFLFVTSILQQFDVRLEKGKENSVLDYDTDPGYLLAPKPYSLVVYPRNKA